jgi:hypothetical protein
MYNCISKLIFSEARITSFKNPQSRLSIQIKSEKLTQKKKGKIRHRNKEPKKYILRSIKMF